MLRNPNVIRAYWVVTALAFAAALAMLVAFVPTEASMGTIQKIFYMHLPVAILTFVSALIVCIASVAYIMSNNLAWDDLAASAGRMTVLLASIVLLTGMIWGKSAWGYWWTWSPRLTFSLVLWILYVVYLIIRPSIDSERKRAMICAIYGIVAFIDVPLVWVSTKLMPDIHPSSISLEPKMRLTLLVWAVAVLLLTTGLITAGYRIARHDRERLAEDDQQTEGDAP